MESKDAADPSLTPLVKKEMMLVGYDGKYLLCVLGSSDCERALFSIMD